MERKLEKIENHLNKMGIEVFIHLFCEEMYIEYYES